ncbi:sporulation integral membrane protein YlbJ [Tepidibacillus infernus]|uniref:sporulation integral membrane protein YlbJ n=1 Tax=Tepidibacillus infernus TaxID=1806172 RepID=UPI003B745B7A
MNTSKIGSSHLKTLVSGIAAIFLAIAMVMFPDTAFDASLQGLRIWWDIIFPALLPFFITSEVLLGFGVVHFMGVLLEPLMRPLFNVPGVGAFVLAMGFASGYPMGAKLTTRLREQNMITRIEGERLVSFTSTSDPLFLFGAVAVGFFHDVELGVLIALIHYSSSILLGFIMRFHERSNKERIIIPDRLHNQRNILVKAFKAMHRSRLNDGRKLGKLLGDAVTSSIQTLLMIGGFIMVFSVILSILTQIQFTEILTKGITLFLLPLGIAPEMSQSIIYGFFEVTLGAKTVSEASTSIPMVEKLAIVSGIAAWSGISVHAQIAAILQRTDIRYTPFLFARILHTFIAFMISFIVWKPFHLEQAANSLPTFIYQYSTSQTSIVSLWNTFTYQSTLLLWLLFILLLLSLFSYSIKRKHGK